MSTPAESGDVFGGAGVDAASDDAPMKAQRRLGLELSGPRITSVFLFDVVVLVLASHLPRLPHAVAWWAGVAVAAVVTIGLIPTYRGTTLAPALARWVWGWSAPEMFDPSLAPEVALSPGCTPAIDHRRRFSRNVVGVREYRGQLVAAIAVEAVEAEPDVPPSKYQRQTMSSATLPVAAVAAALRQFDVRLDAIDIVSVRRRHVFEAADLSAPRTMDDQHRTWLVLRMDPQHNVAAVAARDSVASTLTAAVERLTDDLHGLHCAARPLTADELPEVDTAVAAGLRPASARPGWGHLKQFGVYATCFWMSPRDITSETLDRLWLHDTDATVVTIRLTTTVGEAKVSAWVRYHSPKRLSKDAGAGLNRLIGRQLAAVRASLPVPARRPPLVVPARALNDHDQLAVRMGPTAVGASPRYSTRPAEASDDARAAAVEPAM